MVSSDDRPPIAANRRAAPPCNCSCGGPPRRTTSTSRHSTPCEWPVPSAFIAASFAANRPAKWIAGTRRRVQYAISPSVKMRRRNRSP